MIKEELEELFEYSEGNLFWKKDIYTRKKGELVGKSGGSHGYLSTSVGTKYMLVHRIIFMMHHGYLPAHVDHIDGNKFNNRIENLRPADASHNVANSKKRKNNTTGYKGVSLNKNKTKYVAKIMKNRKYIHLGTFDDPREAHEAYLAAAKELFNDFARA